MSEPIDFQAKLAEIKRKKAEASTPPTQGPQPGMEAPQWNADVLLPDLNPGLSDAEKELDRFVDGIDIIDGYNRWCGKQPRPEANGRRESIMARCPDPSHNDSNPSAWINIDKQTYYCGGCEKGGDIHDIFALNHGYPVPGYKDGDMFHEMRQRMAESFGFRMKEVSGGKITWIESVPEGVSHPGVDWNAGTDPAGQGTGGAGEGASNGSVPAQLGTASDSTGSDQSGTGNGILASAGSNDGDSVPGGLDSAAYERDVAPDNVAHMWADDEEPELVVYPTINWRAIVPEDTFLFEYMNACCNDDSPEEFHFWHGLLALGNAVGRKVYLSDNPHVRPNLMVCLLGNTGAGKSKSRRYLMEVLREGAPYREDGSSTSGVKQLARPGSGEVLVADLRYEGKDPATSRPLGPQPVNGIVDFDELSVIAAVAARQGSTLTTTLMQIADAVPDIKITSMKNGLMTASEPFCNVTASTQPRAIRNVVGRADASSGFLNRWIFAGGKEKEPEAIGGKHSSTRIELTRAIELFNHVRGWGSFEREIEMDDDAYQLFEDFFRNFIVPTKRKDETDLLKRVDLIFKKLMLLLTINQKLEKVPLQVVQATVKLFDYVIECYGILNSNIGISMMQDVMNDIQNHINRHVAKTKRGASARDIARYTHRKNYSLEQIKKALDTMTALDIIELEPKPPGPGRPTARYRVVGE